MRFPACSLPAYAVVLTFLAAGTASPSFQSDAHSGTVEAALVGIEVVTASKDAAAQQVRRGNGLIIRCDGFILAPSWLFSKTVTIAGRTEPAGEQRITVTTNPGRPGEKRIAARGPRFTSRDVGFAVIKLSDFHAPAASLSLPAALNAGDKLALTYSRWDPAARRFLPVERMSVTVGEPTAQPVSESAGLIPLQPPAPGASPGAVVVGDRNTPIGLWTGSSPDAGFLSTEALHLATNCVTPRPASESEDRDMVTVQGGPLTLPAPLIEQQPDMEGSLSACVAPFQIDRFEVTNEDYLTYWQTLPEERRRVLGFRANYYPWTWNPWPSPQPFPAEIARHPVLGVPPAGARGYAQWKAKRLPTPYEWYLAVMGPGGRRTAPEWIERFLGEKNDVWKRITLLHEQQLHARRELQQDGVFLQGPFRLPWIANTGFFLEPSAWSRQTVTSTYSRFWAAWKEPLSVRPVGYRDYDRGASGMMDALLNASEMAAPYPGPPGLGNPRYFEIQWQAPRPPTIREPWTTAEIQAVTDNRPLQPLSRLYRRLINGPSLEDLMLWSNINEVVQMMTPNAGWSLVYTGENRVSASMMPPDRSPYARAGRPAGFQLWQSMPSFTKREMGRDAPLQGPGERGAPGAQLHYYLPVGFRCAR